MDDQLDQLAAEVSAAGISRLEFEGLVLNLSGQQRRLFLRLNRGPADTIELRSACSIGNVSEAASALNEKLAGSGDPRRVVCELEPHRNQFGERGSLGRWSLVEVSGERAAA